MTFAEALGAGLYSPHSICLTGDPAIIQVFLWTNAAIFASYFLIGTILLVDKDAAVRAMVRHTSGFGAFIFLCGLTHLASIFTLYWGVYRLEAVVMGMTAAVSALTASFVVSAFRGAAVNLFGVRFDAGQLATLIAALIAGAFLLLAEYIKRRKPSGKVDVFTVVEKGFNTLIDQLQEENGRINSELKAMRERQHKQANDIQKLRAFGTLILAHVDQQDRMITALGGTPLARPQLPSVD